MKKFTLIVLSLTAILALTGCQTFFRDYSIGRYETITTITGEAFSKNAFTCAVKNPDELHYWIRFSYHGNVVYAYANDLMGVQQPEDYLLSPGAFNRLDPTKKLNTLKGVEIDYAL